MCGITGYVGPEDSASILSDGLGNLEYRGYDSAGVALVDGSEGVDVYKRRGTIDDLSLPASSTATCGIGHTRWSTHGAPSDRNAHPHTDDTGEVAVVHNGIVSNYEALKADLDGHVFESDTDTEVIPHLIAEERREGYDLLSAVSRATDRLEGSYAIAVTAADHDGIVAARQDSPLVVGHGEDGYFLGSDVTAFVEYTRRVTYLEDGDVAHLRTDGVDIFNDGARVERPIERIEWDASAVGKGGHDHYMLKEIFEQPQALRQTLSGRIEEYSGNVTLELALDDALLQSLDRVEVVACGTSYHAGLYAKELLESYAGISVSVNLASEYRVNDGVDPDRTLVIAVTQSGETADTLSAVRRAIDAGVNTLAVTNTVGSTVTREVDDVVYIRAGPEIGVAATKTFVSQVATLALLAVSLGRTRNVLSPGRAGEFLDDLHGLPDAVQDVLDANPQIERLAEKYADSEAFFFIGRRYGYPVALESALKLKEISYDHAEGFAAGELKHGPLALVTPDTPVVALLTRGTRADETLNNVKEVESRGAPVVGVSTVDDADSFCDATVEVPPIGEMEPLVANVALQLFAYHVANIKGRPIDKPRNLAKSVTVE
ncbi:MAG: glutamine--fructose-6-phosphate transaminase (isomerizing) [Salinigranum sp.]